jgi:carboxypeptidase Taq
MSFNLFKQKMYEIQQLNAMGALLSWDMEVKMPHGGDKSFRADQSSMISGMIHERYTSSDLSDIIDKLSVDSSLSDKDKKEVSITKKGIDKSKKLSKAFVEKESKITSEAYSIWEKAKENSDFNLYKPALNQIVDLLKEKCELYGYEAHPYDALMDSYEEGMTVTQLDPLFNDVSKRLGILIEKVIASQPTKTHYLTQKFEIDKQVKLNEKIIALIGMNPDFYRMDVSSHPFCTHFHPTDVRITTRYSETDLMSSIWSSIHESGHAMYEMGLKNGIIGLPSSQSTSLGIHESQSRFYENNIGRSLAFVEQILPLIADAFPDQMKGVSAKALFHEINYVEPSFIRTESDELTYHYHIMIRYEIEKKLMSGELKADDVRDYWNDMYKTYLKIDVRNDAKGCLQDVHWSFGGVGYFPTYSLGSFYAAQWYQEIAKKIDINQLIVSNQFSKIGDWHSDHIHQHGALLNSDEICVKATGKSLDFGEFESYISDKFGL